MEYVCIFVNITVDWSNSLQARRCVGKEVHKHVTQAKHIRYSMHGNRDEVVDTDIVKHSVAKNGIWLLANAVRLLWYLSVS